MRITRPKLSYSNVIATIALFIALGGAAVAAGLPKKSVGAKQLKPGAVTTKALHRKAVTSGKIAPQAVTAGKLGPFAVLPGNLGNGVVSAEKLGDGSVIASKIKNGAITTAKLENGAVTTNKLGDGVVTSAKIGNGAVNINKLGDGSVSLSKLGKGVIGQLQTSTLESGQTLRGVFDVGSGGKATEVGDQAQGAVTYQFPLAKAPNSTVLLPGETTAECPGGTTDNFTPQASPGRVCVYITGYHNLDTTDRPNTLIDSRLGFGISVRTAQAGESFEAYGLWAVTAP
jgi:hypothetical protein